MAAAYVALGSNVGDRTSHLRRALDAMDALPGCRVMAQSGFHDTAPVGPQDQGRFLNAAARLETSLPPKELLDTLLMLEHSLGRPPREDRQPWGPREIDLDLLLYDGLVFDEPGLTLPHPRLHERLFVLDPLCEIAPELWHPVQQATIHTLRDRLLAVATPVVASGKDACGGAA